MKLRPYMSEYTRHANDHRMMILLWRRQAGKTTTFGWQCLKVMAENRHALCTLVSASLNVGSELTEKEARLWSDILADMRKEAGTANLRLETSVDKAPDWDAWMDIFDKSKLEVKLWHDRTTYSRTKIIAPNVATARGYSGWIFIDEFGFIHDFKSIFEAVEPIASSDPTFRICMATTPPEGDDHYAYELTIPPDGTVFAPNARGNWYTSQAGIAVHRVDAWDAAAAGVPLYSRLKGGKALTPEQHRAEALDRDAWDRNYGLIHRPGGMAACSLLALQTAQQSGAITCHAYEDALPSGWADALEPGVATAIGIDPATTEGDKSNPTGLAIGQLVGGRIQFPVICRYKTADDRKQKAVLTEAIAGIRAAGARLVRLGVDASNERFFAQQIRREFGSDCPVLLIAGGEIPLEQQHLPPRERQTYKTMLGNLLVNHLDDNLVDLPADRWVKDDWRLVVRQKGGFDNRVDSSGHHADTFDASKIAAYCLTTPGGPAEAIIPSPRRSGRNNMTI